MSVYDRREESAYGVMVVEAHYAQNPHILKWWTAKHDSAIADQIRCKHWLWYWGITDEIVKITPGADMDEWRRADPLCSRYAWYNVLMYFAVSRAQQLGLTSAIRKPKWRTCPLCGQRFVEDSLPGPLVERLGIDHLDFCSPCLCEAVLGGSGSDSTSETEILAYLRDLAAVLGRVPPQNFGEGITDLHGIQPEDRLALLRLLRAKPTVSRVKAVYGSWLNALVQAGVLEDGTRRTSRGTQTIAKDGHVCLSLGEKTIDDYLFEKGIPHEREPRYPEGNYRGDFRVAGVMVEFFGLTGNAEYDAKTADKARICKEHRVVLVSIYPQDLVDVRRLERKLERLLAMSEAAFPATAEP